MECDYTLLRKERITTLVVYANNIQNSLFDIVVTWNAQLQDEFAFSPGGSI